MKVNKKGVTLVELIAAMTILTIIIVPVSLVFNQGYRQYFVERDTMEAQSYARGAMNDILGELRNSSLKLDEVIVSTDSSGSTLAFDAITYTYLRDSETLKKIEGEDEEVLSENVKEFLVEAVPEGGEDTLINIKLEVEIGRGRSIVLENSHRLKIKNESD